METNVDHPLKYARLQRQMSLDDLAREIKNAARRRDLRRGSDRQRIWKWENRGVVPNQESQTYLADVFEVDPADVAALGWPHWLPGHDVALTLGDSTVPALREALTLNLDRRTFIAYSAASLAGLAQQWAQLEPGRLTTALDGQPVDLGLVEWLETTATKLTTLVTEQRQHTGPLIDAHLATVTNLIENSRYSEAVGRRLHTLAAGLAQTAGWHRFDQGRQAAAARAWHAALHSAHASGDRDFGAGLLSDLAYQSTWLRQPKTAASILDQAIIRTRHPVARSLLHLRKARAHAALGEEIASSRALKAAETELGGAAGDEPPAWCAWMSEADLAVDAGRCQLDLGHTARAHQLITEGVKLLPKSRAKTRAVFRVYQAEHWLAVGEADQAAAAADESLRVATRIGAPRCVSLVRGLLPGFEPYSNAPGVAELLERARTLPAWLME